MFILSINFFRGSEWSANNCLLAFSKSALPTKCSHLIRGDGNSLYLKAHALVGLNKLKEKCVFERLFKWSCLTFWVSAAVPGILKCGRVVLWISDEVFQMNQPSWASIWRSLLGGPVCFQGYKGTCWSMQFKDNNVSYKYVMQIFFAEKQSWCEFLLLP